MPPTPVFLIRVIIVYRRNELCQKPPSRCVRGDLRIPHAGRLAEKIPPGKEGNMMQRLLRSRRKLHSRGRHWFFQIVHRQKYACHETCHCPLIHEQESNIHEPIHHGAHSHRDVSRNGHSREDQTGTHEFHGNGINGRIIYEPMGEDIRFGGRLERDQDFIHPGFQLQPECFFRCRPR